jgi:hypothetical protein
MPDPARQLLTEDETAVRKTQDILEMHRHRARRT